MTIVCIGVLNLRDHNNSKFEVISETNDAWSVLYRFFFCCFR